MSKNKKAGEYCVKGRKLECPICYHKLFFTRRTLMNTLSMNFFGLNWANKKAPNYIWENCDYEMWFMK